jgi:hypothetical protein
MHRNFARFVVMCSSLVAWGCGAPAGEVDSTIGETTEALNNSADFQLQVTTNTCPPRRTSSH